MAWETNCCERKKEKWAQRAFLAASQLLGGSVITIKAPFGVLFDDRALGFFFLVFFFLSLSRRYQIPCAQFAHHLSYPFPFPFPFPPPPPPKENCPSPSRLHMVASASSKPTKNLHRYRHPLPKRGNEKEDNAMPSRQKCRHLLASSPSPLSTPLLFIMTVLARGSWLVTSTPSPPPSPPLSLINERRNPPADERTHH